jgi:hypothetical protein
LNPNISGTGFQPVVNSVVNQGLFTGWKPVPLMNFFQVKGPWPALVISPATGPGGNPRILPLASRLHDKVEKLVRFLRIIAPQLLDRFQGANAVD